MRNFPLARQIEQHPPGREKDSNLFRKLPRKMCRISYVVRHAQWHVFLNILVRRLSFYRCDGLGFKGSSCVQSDDLRVWKTSFSGHELSFPFLRRGGGNLIG
jgi:hypothetical protein